MSVSYTHLDVYKRQAQPHLEHGFSRAAHAQRLRGDDLAPADQRRDVYKRQAFERGEVTQAELRVRRFRDFLRHYGLDADPQEVGEAYTEALSRSLIHISSAKARARRKTGWAAPSWAVRANF